MPAAGPAVLTMSAPTTATLCPITTAVPSPVLMDLPTNGGRFVLTEIVGLPRTHVHIQKRNGIIIQGANVARSQKREREQRNRRFPQQHP